MPGFKINLEAIAGRSYYFMIEPDMAFGGNMITMSSRITQIDKAFVAAYEAVEISGP